MRNRRRGVVYIQLECVLERRSHQVEGHWEVDIGSRRRRHAEEGPGWNSLSAAIAWARYRAPTVTLRFDRDMYRYRYIEAGDVTLRIHSPVTRESEFHSVGEETPEWVRRRSPSAGRTESSGQIAAQEGPSERHPDYGGEVFLLDRTGAPDHGAPTGYAARWETVRDGGMHLEAIRAAEANALGQIVEWARARADYILVTTGPRRFEYWSAGESQFDGLDLPSLDELAVYEPEALGDADEIAEFELTLQESTGRQFPWASETGEASLDE